MNRTLHIVHSAYRANLEEQDDPILWLIQCMQASGADGDVLLRGTAVCYGIATQDASGLAFGSRRQTRPPEIAGDLARMLGNGATVHYVSDDAQERGVSRQDLVPGLMAVDAEKVADLLGQYDRVFAW